jgi:hypothetical protein
MPPPILDSWCGRDKPVAGMPQNRIYVAYQRYEIGSGHRWSIPDFWHFLGLWNQHIARVFRNTQTAV